MFHKVVARFSGLAVVSLLSLVLALGLTFRAFSDTVTYQYDELGRLIEVTDTDGNDTDYSFDPAGNRTNQDIAVGTGPSPNFTVSDAQAEEGNNLVFTVTLHSGTGGSYSVDYATQDNSANSADYNLTSGTLNFTSVTGTSSQTVPVTSIADSVREKNNETFFLNLTNATVGAMIADAQGTGSILTVDSSNRTPIGGYEYYRPANRFDTFDNQPMLGSDPDGDNILIGNIIGQSGLDLAYTIISADKKSFSVRVIDRNFGHIVYEIVDPLGAIGISCFKIGVIEIDGETGGEIQPPLTSPPPSGCPNSSSGGWQASPDSVSFAIDDVSATEGGDLSFTVTKAGIASQTYSLEYDTADGTADTSDYTATSGGLTFSENQTSKIITVSTTFDGEAETSETAFVNLSSVTGGASITDTQGIGTINNGGPPPDSAAFSVDDVSVTEGGDLVFTVTKSGTATQTYTVDYATADGTATLADNDYTAIATTTLTFLTTDTAKTVTVTTTGDTVFEANETLNLNLSNASVGSTISDAQGIGTINNDDPAPDNASFSIDDVSVTEGGSLVFTVTKSGTATQTYTVDYATADGTATVLDNDYTAIATTTLTFLTADTTKTVTVLTTGDVNVESNETLNVNLSNASGTSTISDSQGIGTINDDDTPPDNASFSINNVSVTEGGNLVFTVTKAGTATQTYTVDYATSDGTATVANNDYTAIATTTLTFLTADTTKTVTVSTIQDTTVEANETLNVNLSNASGTSTITDTQGVGTINNDDTAPNQPPTAVDDGTFITFEGELNDFTVLNNDSDPESDPLTITSVSNVPAAIGVTIQCSSTCVRVTTPTRGLYSFTYHISDGNGGTDSATVSLNVKRDLGLLSLPPADLEEESTNPEGQ